MNLSPLPLPSELGFPGKFSRFYDDQLRAIDRVISNPKRFTALAMPTGSGKSVTGIAVALLHPEVKRALYLTSTKGLQDQLSNDFQQLGLFDVRGQRNYRCDALSPGGRLDRYRRGRKWSGCDEGPCHSGVRCRLAPQRDTPFVRPDCTYYGAVYDARRSPLVSTNYAMYLTGEEYAEGLGAFDLLILDEAHDADKELENFLAIDLTEDDARQVGSKLLKGESAQTWKEWAIHHKDTLSRLLQDLELQPPADADSAQERRRLKNVHGKLTRLAAISPLDWIVDQQDRKTLFAPMKVSAYAESSLFRGIKHVLLMSATMTRKTCQLLGIKDSDVSFWECPSRFPVARRPIINVCTTPSVRVNIHMTADDKYMWVRRIDRLIDARRKLGRKGIIHTVSYQRMRDLLQASDHKDIMIVHDTAGTREAIRLFKASKRPNVLVSPSIVTGYDFPGDECRYQIVGKVPFPDMRGAIMKARGEFDKEYAGYLAMIKLVQACGRGMRGVEDWVETFIVDDIFSDYFWRFNQKHAPKWFKDAIEYVDEFPRPLEF